MASRDNNFIEITPEVLLKAYACGIFPMAESAEDPALYWIEPDHARHHPARHLPRAGAARAHRAHDPLHRHGQPRLRRRSSTAAPSPTSGAPAPGSTPASARSTARSMPRAIATPSRSMTAAELVGGLYGVSLGRAFFGESMFHRARDASKIALVHLVARLQGRRLQPARHAIRDRPPEDLRRARSAQAAVSSAVGRRARRRRRFRRAADEPAGQAATKRWRRSRERDWLSLSQRRQEAARLRRGTRRAAHAAACGLAPGFGARRRRGGLVAAGGYRTHPPRPGPCRLCSRSATRRRSGARPRAGRGSPRTSSR